MSTTTNRARKRKLTAAAVVAGAGALLTTTGVYAALQAQAFNSTGETVTSGTLLLTLANVGDGFGAAATAPGTLLTNLAPGDTVHRYVDIKSTGTLDAQSLTLRAAVSTANNLSDATRGLQVSIAECAGSFTPATQTSANGAGGCATPTSSALGATTPLSSFVTGPVALSAPTITAGVTRHLRVTLTLPDQTETSQNGALPTVTGGTIQGLSTAITWTFTDVQRTAQTVSS